jgi:RND family efflux transporter MFP subunit
VGRQEAKKGEIVAANAPIVSIISSSEFEIESNVPEADIAKLELGDDAEATLDAYGRDVVFSLKVVAIDPVETIIDGVATYKATFQFSEKSELIKSGMTADIDILTDYRQNVIIIPQRALITKNGDKFVRLLQQGETKESRVKTGLVGSDGNIEITEGLKEGDQIIISFE